ncbi:MAG: ribonuclease PH [Planctomycetes bacterium]|nr:ribonuclease PH [Planctomycetota bacterium]MDP6423590.1 ribonuclease PH [Planctomycetota bacterium]
MSKRNGDRPSDALREITIQRGFTKNAAGSVLIAAGETVVLCTCSHTDAVPAWLQHSGHGWLTAEYSMLPGSTPSRKAREASLGRRDGRSMEIQRLIGRCLRMAVHLKQLPEMSFWIDCDVLSADGGTRTLAITGGYVALFDALRKLEEDKRINKWPIASPVAACSVGIVDGEPRLDLCAAEDNRAEVDMNVAMTGAGGFVEVQSSSERATLNREQFDAMLDLAERGCRQLLDLQEEALRSDA